jgi:hypothetical protein
MKPHNEICEVYSVQFAHSSKLVRTFTPTNALFVPTMRQKPSIRVLSRVFLEREKKRSGEYIS